MKSLIREALKLLQSKKINFQEYQSMMASNFDQCTIEDYFILRKAYELEEKRKKFACDTLNELNIIITKRNREYSRLI